MKAVEYGTSDIQHHWLSQTKRADWNAGQRLYELLRENRLGKLYTL